MQKKATTQLLSHNTIGVVALALLISACSTPPTAPSNAHILDGDARRQEKSDIPAPVQNIASVPRPKAAPKAETYSVVVNGVKVQELLFALARDAKLNVDIHPGITGTVTLNAIDQTLQQLLQRISKQVDIRWELDGPNLAVMPDTPFLRTYKVDYVNMSRDASGTIAASSQISTGSSGSSSGSSGGSNVSSTKVENKVSNHFWTSLESNIKDILRETDKILPDGSSETVIERSDQQSTTGTGANANSRTRGATAQQGLANSPNPAELQQDENTTVRRTTFREAASVIVNPETGILTIRATSRQHEKIQEFIDQVSTSARRQVMIEATIVEVELSDYYRQGINWSRLRGDGSNAGSINTTAGLSTLDKPTAFTLSTTDKLSSISLTLSLLEKFGNVKVLSSPKLSVLNNQSAVMKVVENFVYFTVKADIAAATVAGGAATKAFTTTPQSVSVGLVMTVTPQISENGSITLNVRPSITSISGTVQDPNPDLTTVSNFVPKIRTREIESVMRVEDGEIAVLGGLMQEKGDYATSRIPGLGAIPVFGEIFTARDNATTKSELVIFLRPVVIRDPSVAGDYKRMREFLPNEKFLAQPSHAKPFGISSGGVQQ